MILKKKFNTEMRVYRTKFGIASFILKPLLVDTLSAMVSSIQFVCIDHGSVALASLLKY